jgi:hypothetical protein
MGTYWTRTLQRRISRRRVLVAAGSAGAGALAIALAGCGGGDGDSESADTIVYKPADSTSKAARGGIMQLYMGTGTETFDQVTGNFAVQAHTDHA